MYTLNMKFTAQKNDVDINLQKEIQFPCIACYAWHVVFSDS